MCSYNRIGESTLVAPLALPVLFVFVLVQCDDRLNQENVYQIERGSTRWRIATRLGQRGEWQTTSHWLEKHWRSQWHPSFTRISQQALGHVRPRACRIRNYGTIAQLDNSRRSR